MGLNSSGRATAGVSSWELVCLLQAVVHFTGHWYPALRPLGLRCWYHTSVPLLGCQGSSAGLVSVSGSCFVGSG